jgi:6-phosphogluconolactonase (cycloisomerase 2 family)
LGDGCDKETGGLKMTEFSSCRQIVISGSVLVLLFAGGAFAQDEPGAVYAMTNASTGNSILRFDRGANGALTGAGSFATGGHGSGSGLGSQGALTLTSDQRWLLAVNAGSNDVTVFSVTLAGLEFRSKTPSGGTTPISVAIHGRLVYVLNAGTPNISGFRLSSDGTLSAIPGSTQTINGATGPAEVAFNAEGNVLIVTDKPTNQIFTFQVNDDGVATAPVAHASGGATPFGFAVDQRDHVVVSDAHGGPSGTSALSSYEVNDDGSLWLITGPIGTNHLAACWVVITQNDKFTYTSDTGSGVITGFSLGRDGSLTLLDSQGVSARTGTGSTPTDLALSENSRFLFSLNGGVGAIAGWRIESDGALVFTGGVTGIPASASGIAAR